MEDRPKKRVRLDGNGQKSGSGSPFLRDGLPHACPEQAPVMRYKSPEEVAPLHTQNATFPASDDGQYICFGMLRDISVVQTKGAVFGGNNAITPAFLRPTSPKIQVSIGAEDAIGFLEDRYSKILAGLLSEEDLRLQCYINPTQIHGFPSQDLLRKGSSTKQKKSATKLSVVLYGPRDLSDDVDEFLSGCDESLQVPLYCDQNVPYRNPQSTNRDDPECPMTFDIRIGARSESTTLLPSKDPSSILENDSVVLEAKSPAAIVSPLYSHQKQALAFMLKREAEDEAKTSNETVTKSSKDPRAHRPLYYDSRTSILHNHPELINGGILADSMGLGKSLSTLALIATDLGRALDNLQEPRTTLIVVPHSLIQTWEAEIQTHLHPHSIRYYVHQGPKRARTTASFPTLQIVLTSYETVAAEWRGLDRGIRPLYLFRWHRIILDEAHEIRSGNSLRAKAVYALKGERRWAVSGTPIQNKWEDLASLLYFLRAYPVNIEYKEIKAILRTEEGRFQVKRLLISLCLRRPKSRLNLPARIDQLRGLEFEPSESALYHTFKDNTRWFLQEDLLQSYIPNYAEVLSKINSLRQICNLGVNYKQTLVIPSERSPGNLRDLEKARQLFDSILSMGQATCQDCRKGLSSIEADDEPRSSANKPSSDFQPRLTLCGKILCYTCFRLYIKGRSIQGPNCGHDPSCQWFSVNDAASLSTAKLATICLPVKMKALQDDLRRLPSSDKSIVFSFWTSTLNIVEAALNNIGYPFVRIDGAMSLRERQEALDSFVHKANVRVILISLRCGANGLNLTAANHVFLMEPQWNPMQEDQALDRVYRIGQTKDVTTVRYIIKGTIEERIREQQDKKRDLAEQAYALSQQNHSWIKQVQDLLSAPEKTHEDGASLLQEIEAS